MSTAINTNSSTQSVSAKISLDSLSFSIESLAYTPNTLKTVSGVGTSSVTVESLGNGQVQTVYAENDAEKKSKVMFEVTNNVRNRDIVIDLKRDQAISPERATITLTEEVTGLQEVYTNMALVNDPERSFNQDTYLSLEFEGNPVIAG